MTWNRAVPRLTSTRAGECGTVTLATTVLVANKDSLSRARSGLGQVRTEAVVILAYGLIHTVFSAVFQVLLATIGACLEEGREQGRALVLVQTQGGTLVKVLLANSGAAVKERQPEAKGARGTDEGSNDKNSSGNLHVELKILLAF